MSNYFPMGFVYPTGPKMIYSDANPDPAIDTLKARVAYLNLCHTHSSMPGHTFAAALKMLQERSAMNVETFWDTIQKHFSPTEVSEMAMALSPLVAEEPERLDFPNAIALVDCRFVSTLEWQHLRRYSIGGSEAAVVVGKVDTNGDQIDGFTQLSKFQTRRGLFYEKQATFVEVPNSPQKQQIFDYGHCVEPYVIQKAAKELRAKQYPEYRMFAHKDYPFITCNPDGILIFPNGSLCLFEAKTATHHKKDDWMESIPEYYIPQPTQYMEVLDDPRIAGGYIGCCFGPDKYDWIMHSYQRDWLIGKKQIEIEAAFWQNYIAAGVIPPLSGKAELDMAVVYGYDNAPTMNLTSLPHSSVLPAVCEPLFEEYQRLSHNKKALTSAMNAAYTKERNIKTVISLQVPEGLTVIKQPNELSYRVSLKHAHVESVDTGALRKINHQAEAACIDLARVMAEEDIAFNVPKVVVAKRAATKKITKKGV